MIRPIIADDTPTLVRLTADTEMFKPLEIRALQEVLHDYFNETMAQGHRAYVMEEGHRTLGYVYYAPAAMAENTWYLYWIAVDRTLQGQGIGAKLLAWVEDDIRMREGRLLLIETSMLPHYEPTRRFYQKRGYETAACLRDWYADGDDMIIFRKRLTGLDAPLR
jgi:ribosomal protein S18 acetylase RimI-like enzyme